GHLPRLQGLAHEDRRRPRPHLNGEPVSMRKLITAAILLLVAGAAYADEAGDLLKRIDKVRNPYESFEVDLQLTSHRDAAVETYHYKVSGRVDGKSLVQVVAPASE